MQSACCTRQLMAYLISVVQDFNAVVQLHVLTDLLVDRLHAVRSTPEELWRIQHSAQQVDCTPLDEYLSQQLRNLLP